MGTLKGMRERTQIRDRLGSDTKHIENTLRTVKDDITFFEYLKTESRQKKRKKKFYARDTIMEMIIILL